MIKILITMVLCSFIAHAEEDHSLEISATELSIPPHSSIG